VGSVSLTVTVNVVAGVKTNPDQIPVYQLQATGENTSIDGMARIGEISLRYGVVLLIR